MNWLLYNYILLATSILCSCCDTSRKTVAPVSMTSEDKASIIELNRKMVEDDDKTIEAYIKKNSLPMTRFAEGYYGMVSKQGEGIPATDNTTLTIRATIRLLSGKICYKDSIITFQPGNTVEISGLHRVAASLRKGATASYIFPPLLAYGIYGDGKRIPQRSILRYDIEVLNVTLK